MVETSPGMMTRRTFQAGLLLAASLGGAQAETSVAPGTWSGMLATGGLRLRLKLDLAADGTATLFSLDQGGAPLPGRVTSSSSDRLELEFPAIRAAFSGRIVSPDRIEGLWRQGANALPLAFERGEAALTPLAPPSPLTKERLAELRAAAGSPAMAAASARRQSPVHVWVDGERAIGTGVAVEETDIWHLGSITKSMTSSLVARLADIGALRWDETVGDVLGAVAPEMRDAYRAATFRHLLCHRSGLPGNLPVSEVLQFSRDIADAREERTAYVRKALAMEPVGPMETTFTYSNDGYVVAAAMLETKLGKSWEDLTAEHLFGPLGLSTAGFGAPGHAGETDQPVGHTIAPPGEARRAYPVGGLVTDNPVVIGPAGRIHMSLQDLLRYLVAHRDRTDYLKPEGWTVLHTPPFGGEYAMGWFVRRNGALWHSGSNTLWYAEAMFDGAGGIVAAAAANDGYVIKSLPAVAEALREAVAAA
ncbi:MAG TPA: serine hydrolase domain-containing protein [Xanthobacteraceae bacterium]|nr:serine hydrolase domain-containing protein [Xanthobacteraceae bacterium]